MTDIDTHTINATGATLLSAPPVEYTEHYFLTAGECDAQSVMPLTLLAQRIIEIATQHANRMGIGYANLKALGIAWVLSRLTTHMDRMPAINEPYSITTWIEGINRLYSDRCFRIDDANGNPLGWARSVWAAIDVHNRAAADLSRLDTRNLICDSTQCPLPKTRKHPPVEQPAVDHPYMFKYMDLDFNGHVNSVRYIEHILNCWPRQQYDRWRIRDFAINYYHECHYGEHVDILTHDRDPEAGSQADMLRGEDRVVSARIEWGRREE